MTGKLERGIGSSPKTEEAAPTKEQEKSLLVAMAIKRWARNAPGVKIEDGKHISSKSIEDALLGAGLHVETTADLTRDGFKRINAGPGAVGLDNSLVITKEGEGRYLLKLNEGDQTHG